MLKNGGSTVGSRVDYFRDPQSMDPGGTGSRRECEKVALVGRRERHARVEMTVRGKSREAGFVTVALGR